MLNCLMAILICSSPGESDVLPEETVASRYLDGVRRERVQMALEKSARWLTKNQDSSGAFRSQPVEIVPSLPLTAK